MQTESPQKMASQSDATRTISLTTPHQITWDNIYVTCLANTEIRNMLLRMFRDVYVHDDSQENSTPCIIDIMSQVRLKTSLKIVKIELCQRVRSEEYNFLFGIRHEHEDELMDYISDRNQHEHECKITGNTDAVLTLYTDKFSMEMANNTCQLSSPQVLKAFSHIVDAMAAAPNPGICNTFAMVALEVSTQDVRECQTANSAQYARNRQEFHIVKFDSIMPRLSLEIQQRGPVNTMAMYMYGPFPSTETEKSSETEKVCHQ